LAKEIATMMEEVGQTIMKCSTKDGGLSVVMRTGVTIPKEIGETMAGIEAKTIIEETMAEIGAVTLEMTEIDTKIETIETDTGTEMTEIELETMTQEMAEIGIKTVTQEMAEIGIKTVTREMAEMGIKTVRPETLKGAETEIMKKRETISERRREPKNKQATSQLAG